MSQPDHYNKGGMIAFVFSMVFTILFFIYISFIHPGVRKSALPANAPSSSGEKK